MNFQKWISNIQSQFFKQKLSLILLQTMNIKNKWTEHFQKSIQLWIQYIFLKTKSQYNNLIQLVESKISNQKEEIEFQKKILILLSQTEQCVIKGLINVQKLYMIPQVRQKKIITQKQSLFNFKERPKSFSKTRSSSLTNNRKSPLFNTGIKPYKQNSYVKNSTSSTTESFNKYAGITSTITKNLKGKPKYEKFVKKQQISNKQYDLTINSLSNSNWNNNLVENQLHQSLIEHLQQKQKIGGKLLDRVEQKMKNIQQNINQKLSIIMENLIKCQKTEVINEQKQSKKQLKQIKSYEKQQKKELILEKDLNFIPKQRRKSSFVKKCTKNEIFEQQHEVQEIIINEQGSKNNKIIQNAEKSFCQFINQAKKVKLPISQQFICIFYNCYRNLCKKLRTRQNLQKLEIPKDKIIAQIQETSYKKQYKQSLIKLKKLLAIDTIKKDIAQKIQIYIKCAIRSGYIMILFKDDYEVNDELTTQINKITQKL